MYWSARPVPVPTFAFLGGRAPEGQEVQQMDWGRRTVANYRFTAQRYSIYRAARAELVPLGYSESSAPPQVGEAGRLVPAAQDRLRAVVFSRATGRTLLQVHIARGYALPAIPETFTGAEEVDWVHVRIERWQMRFALRGWLRGQWRKLFGRRPNTSAASP